MFTDEPRETTEENILDKPLTSKSFEQINTEFIETQRKLESLNQGRGYNHT